MSRHDDDFSRRRQRFDREFEKMGRRIGAAWTVGAVLAVAFVVVVIWAIVQLVGWVTAQ
jgi:hypothetical protein